LTTLHRLLERPHREGGLPAGCALIVDEAGMAETRVLTPALPQVEEAARRSSSATRTSFPEVGAGGLFAGVVDAIRMADQKLATLANV
jgi:hypothetical protein